MPDDCIFCSIVAGDIPSRRVYEDDTAIAFLDLGPWSRGHTLVVPRQHVDDLLTNPPQLSVIGPAIDATARLLVDKLNADTRKALADADVKKRFADLGVVAVSSTPAEFSRFIRSESDKFAKLIREANIKVNQ